MFKKKSASAKRRRPRRTAAPEEDEEEDTSQRLAELRAEQRERRRGGGIAPEKLAALAVRRAPGDGTAKEADEAAEEGGGPKALSMAQFTGTSTSEVTVEMQHESLMNAFIEKRLGIRKEAEAGDAQSQTEEDRLYALPAHLRVKPGIGPDGRAQGAATGSGGAAAETEGLGGPLAWGSGIAEVALPAEETRRNIEATEKAIRALKALQEREKTDPLAVRSDSGNVSVNFGKHRRDYAQEIRRLADRRAKAQAKLDAQEGKGGEEASGNRAPRASHSKRHRKGPQPTDERTIKHFKKNNRR